MTKEINPAWDDGDELAFGEDTEYITPKITHNIRPKGNQGQNKETKTACTIVWAVNQIIRLFGLDLDTETTNKLYIEAVKFSVGEGYVIGGWRSTPYALNSVRKRRNTIACKTFKKEKVFTARLYRNNPKIIEALNNGHLVWYTKNVNFGTDQVEGLVRRDPKMYPKMVGHRLNRKGIEYTKATGGADLSNAERWSQDNYHWAIGENFWFKEVKPYINNWIYAYWYIVMPESCLKDNIEAEKERIARLKAVNATIWVLSSTYSDLNTEEQLMASSLATELRNTPGSRERIEDPEKKAYQWVVDYLSYAWKFAWEEEKKKYSELASYLRAKHWLL